MSVRVTSATMTRHRTRSMNMHEIPIVLLFALPGLILAVVAWVVAGTCRASAEGHRGCARRAERRDRVATSEHPRADLGWSASTAAVQQIEQRERELSERQESYEIQHTDERPYDTQSGLCSRVPVRIARVTELELSESEAELIVPTAGAIRPDYRASAGRVPTARHPASIRTSRHRDANQHTLSTPDTRPAAGCLAQRADSCFNAVLPSLEGHPMNIRRSCFPCCCRPCFATGTATSRLVTCSNRPKAYRQGARRRWAVPPAHR